MSFAQIPMCDTYISLWISLFCLYASIVMWLVLSFYYSEENHLFTWFRLGQLFNSLYMTLRSFFIPWYFNFDVACGFMVLWNRISLFDMVQSMPFDKFPMIKSHVSCFISSDVASFLYPRASFFCIVRTISSIQFPVCNTNIWISAFDLAAPVVM